MPTQINIWASDDLTAKLTELCPKNIALSAFCRTVLERLVEKHALPSLVPEKSARTSTAVSVNWEPFFEAIAGLREHLDERLRETQRAVHEHGGRLRSGLLKADAVADQEALDRAERAVREWEKWTMAGRE